jgi:KipI family sensor histidine kinase inhibitor
VTRLRVLPYGERALLLEVDGTPEVHALRAALDAAALEGVVELVPAARTVLVLLDPGVTRLDTVAAAAQLLDLTAVPAPSGTIVQIEVSYDGSDLGEVARRTGLTGAEVVALHTAPTYTAAFSGFAPGFAYLTGLDPRLRLPRRDTPRTRVPAGSVAIASEFAAVYPTASPGGWHLLGRTDRILFDPHRDPPALLPPGTRVQFVPT